MNTKEMIEYINNSLQTASSTGHLSELGEKFIDERMRKSEDQGGFSNYWKETSLEDALKNKGRK